MKTNNSADNTANTNNSFSRPIPPEQLSTDIYYGMSFARIGPSTVVSRSNDGQIRSRFLDDVWTLENYAYNVVDNPNFEFSKLHQDCEHRIENVNTCKKILLMKMFAPNLRTGKPLRLATVHSIQYVLTRISEYCAQRNLRVIDIFQCVNQFKDFQKGISPSESRNLIGIVRTLNKISVLDRGFHVDGHILPTLKKPRDKTRRSSQQVPIIPSRILLLKYQQYHSYLDEFSKHHKNICKLLEQAAENPFYGRGYATSSKAKSLKNTKHNFQKISFADAVKENHLSELCEKYQWSMVCNVTAFLTTVSHCAKNLIHLYTLMRNHEVKSISYDCLTPVKGWNNEALYIAGITTKVYSSRQPKKWITTKAIIKPIDALRKISDILSPHVNNPENYLLLSPSTHPASNAKASGNNIITNDELDLKLAPTLITEEDIEELEAIDPLRNWRGDRRFAIGTPWKITSHQFRRTMTVFCAQTGLITIPALKRLLGHLTKVMCLYYTQGCSAQNYTFKLLNPQLAKEFREAKAEADGAMFIREALQSTERLYGIKGSEIMNLRSHPTWLSRAASETIKMVKQGLVAYTESPLGGCASTDPCDKRAHGDYFSCPGCRHLIAKESVLNDSQTVMEFDLSELDPNSLEYRAEKQNLDDFVQLRKTITSKLL